VTWSGDRGTWTEGLETCDRRQKKEQVGEGIDGRSMGSEGVGEGRHRDPWESLQEGRACEDQEVLGGAVQCEA
jgi:hypothetical protein